MRDYWPPIDPHADLEADAICQSRAAQRRAKAAEKLARWMEAIEARIAQLHAAGATSVVLDEGFEGELPSITFTFATNPKQAAQAIFDDAYPRFVGGLL